MAERNAETGSASVQGIPVGSSVPFDSINSPGAYVFNQTGHLLRVPADAIAPGRSPLMTICAKGPLMVTKLSDNPFITLPKAAQKAADQDISPNWV